MKTFPPNNKLGNEIRLIENTEIFLKPNSPQNSTAPKPSLPCIAQKLIKINNCKLKRQMDWRNQPLAQEIFQLWYPHQNPEWVHDQQKIYEMPSWEQFQLL